MSDARSRRPDGGAADSRFGYHLVTVSRAIADFASVMIAFVLGYSVYVLAIRSGVWHAGVPKPAPYVGIALLFGTVASVSWTYLGLYRRRASMLNMWELEAAVKGLMLAAAVFFALLFFLKLGQYSRLLVVCAITGAFPLVLIERRAVSLLVRRLQVEGRAGRRVLICGCTDTGMLLLKKIVQAPHLGCTVVGFIDDSLVAGDALWCRITQTGSDVLRVPVLGRFVDLEAVLDRVRPDEVLIALPSAMSEESWNVVEACRARGVHVGVVPQMGALRADAFTVDDLGAIPVLRPCRRVAGRWYLFAKRVFDTCAACLFIIITCPLWLLAATLVKFGSSGPIFFVHDRVGLNGRRFRMLKFRTMRCDTPEYAHSPAGEVDARITRVGRFLRMGGIDELPQLLNVIRGDMSIVGPRPEMPFIVDGYTPLQRERLRVKPGITGLWQLSVDRHAEIHENLEYDLYYIAHQSMRLDVLILLETTLFTAGVIGNALVRVVQRTESESLAHQPRLTTSIVRETSHDLTRMVPEIVRGQRGGIGIVPRHGDRADVLVALDQRCNGLVRPHWRTSIAAACSLADDSRAYVLVARANRAALERLLRSVAFGVGHTYTARVVPVKYRGRDDFVRMLPGTALVLTDSEHIAEWARVGGVDALLVSEDETEWRSHSGRGEQIADRISRFIEQNLQSTNHEDEVVAAMVDTAGYADSTPPYSPTFRVTSAADRREEDDRAVS